MVTFENVVKRQILKTAIRTLIREYCQARNKEKEAIEKKWKRAGHLLEAVFQH